jgi:predicted Zn-dependent protease
MDRLADALGLLPEADQKSVDEVIALIQKGDNDSALKRLNDLNKSNPENSSLRVLTGYAMLRLGNVLGALEQADKAHEAPNGNSYKCWFYSKVALLNGQTELCKRELNHVKKNGDLPAEARDLEKELRKKKG